MCPCVVLFPLLFVAAFATADPGWIRRVTDETPPFGGGNALAYDSSRGKTVWVRGNQTWEWDGSHWLFRGVLGTGLSEHAMVFDSVSARSIVYGGSDRSTWAWNGSAWSKISTSGPSGTREHAMAFDSLRNRIVQFGGHADIGGVQPNVWEWIGNGWIPRISTGGPSPRYAHAMAFDSVRGRVVLFGGIDTVARGDTWEWDGTRWWLREAQGPSPRGRHAMAFDSIRRRAVLFGGLSQDEVLLSDTWEWDGFNWHLRTTEGPDPGADHAMAYDSRRGRIVLYGQYANAVTWELPSSEFYVAPGADPEQPQVPNPALPEPSQRNLLFVTHGAGTDRSTFQDQWAPLAGRLMPHLGADWQVVVHDWSPRDDYYLPGPALARALQEARALGSRIPWTEYDHAHLVAHSAGSRLITELVRLAKARNPKIIIHSTYLDAYAGVAWLPTGAVALSQTYGSNSDWAEQYFSREGGLAGFCLPPTYTGDSTQVPLLHAINVDVSRLDPQYTADCQSRHSWPVCFWRYSASAHAGSGSPCVAGPTGPYAPWGYPLGFESWSSGGDSSTWLAFVRSWYPPNGSVVEVNSGAVVTEANAARTDEYLIRTDGPINFSASARATSDNASIVINGSWFDAKTTHGTAWINVAITTTEPVNFLKYETSFTSIGAQGLLSVYIDNTQIDAVDERFCDVGTNGQTPMLEADLQPGPHVVSFRLDQFGGIISRSTIKNVSTGWAGFVPAACVGDATGDGEVNFADITAALTNWGFTYPNSTGPGDANHDGVVNFADVTSVLTNWGLPCS